MSEGRDELRVPKIEGHARVELVDGSWIEGELFLSAFSDHHQGPEQVRDLLLRKETFLPFRLEGDGVRMIERLAIVQIRIARAKGIRELDPAGLLEKAGKLLPARVALRTGETLEGHLPILPERAQAVRALDWLNDQGTFVPVLAQDLLIYVARSAILWVEEAS